MREDTIIKENGAAFVPMDEIDETDRKIMRALTDELSEVTVSEELIAATLRKAGLSTPQNMEENGVLQGGVQDKPLQEKAEGNLSAGSGGSPKKTTKKNLSAFYVRGITFAAAVLILVVFGMLKVGKMGASKKADFSAGSSGQEAGNLNLSGSEESTTSDYNTMDGAHTGEWFDDNHVNNMDGNIIEDVGEGNFNQISPMPGESLSDALCSEPEDEDMKEWMYQQLLAEFDKAVAMEEADVEHKKDQDGDIDGYRSISWQKEEVTLSCVVYREDYRIEAVLTLNGQTRSLVLTDWIYAGELWEMAGET